MFRDFPEEVIAENNHVLECSVGGGLNEFIGHFLAERNHQGKRNVLLFPSINDQQRLDGSALIQCHERLGGLLKYYYSRAA